MGTTWSNETDIGAGSDTDASNWTDETAPSDSWTDETAPSDATSWEEDSWEVRDLRSDGEYWNSWLNPDPQSGPDRRRTFLGMTEGPEDFHVLPEDVNLQADMVQDDDTQWTIESEPD